MATFRIKGLSPEPFAQLYGLSEDELSARSAKRYVVDQTPGFPDRIEMRDLEIGETAILVNYEHQPANTPFRSSHAVYVREGATKPYDRVNQVPEVMRLRTLSLRAFDADGMLLDADLIEGRDLETLIDRFFANPEVGYIHAHYARPGCFAARIDRV
jgi:hypothetical protein